MTILVAVTDNPEGVAALRYAAAEADRFSTPLLAVNLTAADLDTAQLPSRAAIEVVVPPRSDADEIDNVLKLAEERQVDRIVVGVRRRSALGKVVLGSIAQQIILEATVPVVAVKNS